MRILLALLALLLSAAAHAADTWIAIETQKDQAAAVAALDGWCTDGFIPACTRLGYAYAASSKPGDRDKARKLFAQACADGQEDACSAAK